MSESLSARLLREINDQIPQNEVVQIEVFYEIIPGMREGSSVIWAFEEENLYYRNNYVSKKTGQMSCKCQFPNCNVRLYIKDDGTAFR